MLAKKGDWVEIENTILASHERAAHLPEDTKKRPLNMWVRGYLISEEGKLGDSVKIKTLASRIIEGKLVEMKPRHNYDFGDTVKELIDIGEELKEKLSALMGGEK